MQGIVNRGHTLGADADHQHLSFTLSSARSLPVVGKRSGWTAWDELASLANSEDDTETQLAASHLPLARAQHRQPAAGLARTLYSDLPSSRSENARALYAPQPRSAWTELEPSWQDAAALRQPLRVSGNETDAVGQAGLSGRHQFSARHAAAESSLGSADQRSASTVHQKPSSTLRLAAHANQVAMAQGTDDFLSASQGFLREYNRLARLGLAQGNLRIAEENLTQAMELIQQGNLSSTEFASVSYNLLGCMYRRMGRLNEAVDYLQRSLDVLTVRKQAGQPLIECDVDLADVHMNMSSALSALKRHDAALLHVETAIKLLTERLGLEGLKTHETFTSEQDSKDVRMLAIAHYNRGAELRMLKIKEGSLVAFQVAMRLADNFLPPGDSLRAIIKKAHRRAQGEQDGGQGVGAPPGVTPLRLSMLTPPVHHTHLSSADKGGVEDERAKEQPKELPPFIHTPSHRSTSSFASVGTPVSGRSHITPQGCHTLHAVHCGNFAVAASSARRSARDLAAAPTHESSSTRQPRVNFTSTQIQTGLVPVSQETEIRAMLPRNVFKRSRLDPSTGIYMPSHTTFYIYVSACYYVCPHTTIYVS